MTFCWSCGHWGLPSGITGLCERCLDALRPRVPR